MDTLNGSLPIRAHESVATHNISPRLIQLKQTRKPSPPRALYICPLTIEKHQFVPFSFYQKIYMTAIMFFLFFLSGGQHRRIYMNQDREVHIDWTAINAPYFLPFVGPSKKTA